MTSDRFCLPLALMTLTLGACDGSGASAPPPPGPMPLESAEQMTSFLAGSRLRLVGPDEEPDWWDFREDGTCEALQRGESWTGTWTASVDTLSLTPAPSAQPDPPTASSTERHLPLRWLDGKLNIEIDGRQYRRVDGYLGR